MANDRFLGRQERASIGEGAGERMAVQGHGWTETWAACRWAVDGEKEGGRDSFLVRGGRGGVERGGQGERRFTVEGSMFSIIPVDGAAERKYVDPLLFIITFMFPSNTMTPPRQAPPARLANTMSPSHTHTRARTHTLGYQRDFWGHRDGCACRCAPAGEGVLPGVNWFPEFARRRPSAHPRESS